MSQERDYVLGTHDEEIQRLGLQHRVWRPRALDAWRRAGITTGSRVLDVGCGPGWATLDLAAIAGPAGGVVSVDRSRRFLDAASAACAAAGLANVSFHEQDLDEGDLPASGMDAAWVRWVFAFVRDPRALVGHIGRALRPGGRLVLHEYLDYSTWRLVPRSEVFETFVEIVMRSWRENGGEPDVGLALPAWLAEAGFEIRDLRPHLDVVPPSDYLWQWPRAFVTVGLERMLELGSVTPEQAEAMLGAFERAENTPNARCITPLVVEIIAERR